MTKLLAITVVWLVGMLSSVPALCASAEAVAARNYNVEFYDRWADLPTDTLVHRGYYYLCNADNAADRDSALLAYSIVANRYYDSKLSNEERKQSLNAMNNVGYLYFFYYYDYQQGYTWLQKTLTLADKHNFDFVKTYALLNLGNLMLLLDEVNDRDTRELTIDYYRQAWRSAVKMKDWRTAMVIANNISNVERTDTSHLTILRNEIQELPIPTETPLYRFVCTKLDIMSSVSQGNYARALALCDTAEQQIDTRDTPERYLAGIYKTRSDIFLLMGDRQQALVWLDKHQAIAEQHHIRDLLVLGEKSYCDYYHAIGNEAAEQKHQNAYLSKKDSLINQGKLLKASDLYFINQLQSVNKQAEQVAHNLRIWRWAVAAMAIVIMIIGCLLFFLRRKNKQLEEDRQQMYRKMQESISVDKSIHKYRKSPLNDNSKDDLADRIEQVMHQTDVICKDDFTRDKLAEMVGSAPAHISQVINERFGMNFNQLLSEYRIKEACHRISDRENYGNFTIEAIAASVGFKSRSNFAVTFKKITGLTPSQYLREAQKKRTTNVSENFLKRDFTPTSPCF